MPIELGGLAEGRRVWKTLLAVVLIRKAMKGEVLANRVFDRVARNREFGRMIEKKALAYLAKQGLADVENWILKAELWIMN
mmetsp:Transcript_29169/g.33375  ORF Transcript_29169/g.33375 Transcript_29169/m.33375 type:complete len:81 (+) Transcript_29169:416-658(+)